MGAELSLEQQTQLAETFERERNGTRLSRRERVSDVCVGISLLAATSGLWLLDAPTGLALLPTLPCLLVFILASRVRFDTPLGYAMATQVAFVPLVFALPQRSCRLRRSSATGSA